LRTGPSCIAWAAVIGGLVASAAWSTEFSRVGSLMSQGRYAQAYAESLGWGPTASLRGDQADLRAHAAYHALALDDARQAAQRARFLGCESHSASWLPVSEIDRRVTAAERLFEKALYVSVSEGASGYTIFVSRAFELADHVMRHAAAAYQEASKLAYGAASCPASLPPLRIYLFRSNHDARSFLSVLGLHAPTTGSAASLGIGVLLWQESGGRPSYPSPYSCGAVLAHEVLHVFQRFRGVEGAPQWLTEGTAQIAEDLVDPNHRIQTMAGALRACESHPQALAWSLSNAEHSGFELYPVHYLLALTVMETYGPRALGALMARTSTRPQEPLTEALWTTLRTTPEALVSRAQELLASEEAARALVELSRLDPGSEDAAHGFHGASERWPGEPYLAYVAARSLAHVGRCMEATALLSRLEDCGYRGCVDGTTDDLRKLLEGRSVNDRSD